VADGVSPRAEPKPGPHPRSDADVPPVLLDVQRLRAIFDLEGGGELVAVDDLSFAIARGETLGLVGESGSGKSVTALSIMRLVMPPGRIAAGRIEFDGRDLLSLAPAEMRHVRGRQIGFVFQAASAALSPVYTIGYQIEETLSAHGLARGRAARERAVALLEQVRMPEPRRRARDYAHQLSGGLKQRAMIALAIAAEPRLLIADEPTTALDATVQAEILDLLREMRQSMQLAVLLITHDFGVVAELADRVAVMQGGRVVEEGPVGRIFTSPRSPYTRHLLTCIPGAGRDAPPRHPQSLEPPRSTPR
jgi:peptide/nickel transport system ATP-binding protein